MSKDDDKRREPKPHFWIPDSEVEEVVNKPMAIPVPRDIDHSKHGLNLIESVKNVQSKHREKQTPISEELIIFKVVLAETDVADSRKDAQKIFENNDLKINALKKSNEAIVSTTLAKFADLTTNLNKYIDRNGSSQDFFQYIESIAPIESDQVQTLKLKERKKTKDLVDLQVTLVPKLGEDIYKKMIPFLIEENNRINGEMGEDGIYRLSDNTPVLRLLVPSSGIDLLTDYEVILKAEPTQFFEISENRNAPLTNIADLSLVPNVDLNELPIVCVLDDGVNFPANLNNYIVDTWYSNGVSTSTCEHGTKVASRVIFGDNLDEQVRTRILEPKARVLNAVIHDGMSPIYEGTFIKRIREAVEATKYTTTTYCLSFNSLEPIEDSTIGNLAYEIDCLCSNGVNFLLPTGNHSLWRVYDSLDDIISDSSSRIAAPAEAFFGLTIGAITREDHGNSISRKNEISPFSRIGYGFCGSSKPDLVYPGGNVYRQGDRAYIAANSAAYVINNQGFLVQDFGTSFSAPLASADIARLTNLVPNQDPSIARALLIHHAYESEYYFENPDEFDKLYGAGIGSYDNAKDSYTDRATYIRKGSMSRLVKERVKFWMPSVLANKSKPKSQTVKVTVTCVSLSPVDKGMGEEYLRAYVDASLHMINSNGTEKTSNPPNKKGRKPWSHIQHFSQVFTVFNPGDWQIWLQLYTKPEILDTQTIDYVLLVTLEDMTLSGVNLHQGIESETENRFQVLNEVEIGYEDIG